MGGAGWGIRSTLGKRQSKVSDQILPEQWSQDEDVRAAVSSLQKQADMLS